MKGPGVVRLRVLGVAFIALVAGLLTLSVAAYQKVFTPVVWATVEADHTGLQLDQHADVKLRGVLVGEVRSITADGNRSKVKLALDPDQVGRVPSNVSAAMLPKTLFGEKYVELLPPSRPAASPISAGAVIHQDDSASGVEVERVLDKALPLLQAIPPDQLSSTLTAVANAVSGRGERIGNTVTTLDSYLATLNQQMPVIASDVRKLADVLEVYHGALPDLMTILRNLTVTSNTIVAQQQNLREALYDVTGLADTASPFLSQHGGRIVQLGQVARPVLDVLAQYAPEYPCLTSGMVRLQKNIEDAFSTGRLHITLEITKDNGKYNQGEDAPALGANTGPQCYGLPDNSPVPFTGPHVADGYDYGNTHRGTLAALPELPGLKGGNAGNAGGTGYAPMGYAGTPEEQGVVKPLVAAQTGQHVDQVGDISDLLWGPLMRGAVVNAE